MKRTGVVVVCGLLAPAGCVGSDATPSDTKLEPPSTQVVAPPATFAAPVALLADGKVIDHGAAWGHTGPCLFDLDGDGKRDLIVGDFGGGFTFYKNVGTERERRFAAGVKLMAGDEEAKVPVY